MKKSQKNNTEPVDVPVDTKNFTEEHWFFLALVAKQLVSAQYGSGQEWFPASWFNMINLMTVCDVVNSGCLLRRSIESEPQIVDSGLSIVYGRTEYKITLKGLWLSFINRKMFTEKELNSPYKKKWAKK